MTGEAVIGTYVVAAAIAALALGILVTRAARSIRARKLAALAAEVRPQVLSALAEGRDAPTGLTRRRRKVLESIAISLIPKLRGADRDALARMLADNGTLERAERGLSSRSASRRGRSAELIGSAGHLPAAPLLTELLHDADADVRDAAARGLGLLAAPNSIDAIFHALSQRTISAHTASMAVIRTGAAAERGVAGALDHSDALTRSTAIEMAGALGMLPSRVHIEAALDDSSELVRISAVRALGRLAMPSSAAPLIEQLDYSLDRPVRAADDDRLVTIIRSLGQIGHDESVPVLERCIRRRARVSVAAGEALDQMGARPSAASPRTRPTAYASWPAPVGQTSVSVIHA